MTPEGPNENSGKVVCIIEDDLFLLKAYQVKFEKEHIAIQTASDGKEALACLAGDPPAVVLLDLILPGVGGFDVLEAIRKNEKWKNVPVIVLSNLSQSKDLDRAKALGVEDYLVKANTKIQDIVEKVKKYLA